MRRGRIEKYEWRCIDDDCAKNKKNIKIVGCGNYI